MHSDSHIYSHLSAVRLSIDVQRNTFKLWVIFVKTPHQIYEVQSCKNISYTQ